FPEVISNGLASLQQGRPRYVKSVQIDFTPQGQKTAVRFANGVIKLRRRFNYDEVTAILEAADASSPPTPDPSPPSTGARADQGPAVDPDVHALLVRMRELAMILRKRRLRRGALELNMPEVELEYDDQGRVSGGHFARHDVSHQVIEEFMLAANEAVA